MCVNLEVWMGVCRCVHCVLCACVRCMHMCEGVTGESERGLRVRCSFGFVSEVPF